jgi:hypothetical protein
MSINTPKDILVVSNGNTAKDEKLFHALDVLKDDLFRYSKEAGINARAIVLQSDTSMGIGPSLSDDGSFTLFVSGHDAMDIASKSAGLREGIIRHEIYHALMNSFKTFVALDFSADVLLAGAVAETLAKQHKTHGIAKDIERIFGSVDKFQRKVAEMTPSALKIAKAAGGSKLLYASPAHLAPHMDPADDEYTSLKKSIEAASTPLQISEMFSFSNAVENALYGQLRIYKQNRNPADSALSETRAAITQAIKHSSNPAQTRLGESMGRFSRRLRQAEEYAADAYSQARSSDKEALMRHYEEMDAKVKAYGDSWVKLWAEMAADSKVPSMQGKYREYLAEQLARPTEIERMDDHPAFALRAERLRYTLEHGKPPDSRHIALHHRNLLKRLHEERSSLQSEAKR